MFTNRLDSSLEVEWYETMTMTMPFAVDTPIRQVVAWVDSVHKIACRPPSCKPAYGRFNISNDMLVYKT